ncbi:pseudaminic acid cytidylyltransferase [Helicobacter mastomyrinus]|uniref:Pseudaminic acid cytidylyltransferase n=1 Tax=Helicobacter mastomyrinus TaxID=287948 RepID=A0ABZ3F8C0_9HELI|nr:pseudaminic acid cytidylyltransferase [uncultured Helicobacter sp.]
MRKIALIPARSGSKRIPHKNIKLFCGKPIIAYPIQTALESSIFDEVIVSTDSQAIAQIAQEYGAKVPFMRPKELSDDFTPTSSVAAHAIRMLHLKSDDMLCVIYPTAPLLQIDTLKEGLESLLKDNSKQFSFCAVMYEYNPMRSFYIRDDGIEMLFPAQYLIRSQDLEPLFHDAGQFYWGRASAWIENLPIFAPHSHAIVVSPYQAQDIDVLADWELAEMKYKIAYDKLEQDK